MQQTLSVEIYTDKVPLELFSAKVRSDFAGDLSNTLAYAEANVAFEQKVFDEISLPLYAILEPRADGRIVVVDVFSEGKVNDVGEFTRFVTGTRAADKAKLAAAR